MQYREDHYGFDKILDDRERIDVPEEVLRDALVMAGWEYKSAVRRAKEPKSYGDEVSNKKNACRRKAGWKTNNAGRPEENQEDIGVAIVGADAEVSGAEQYVCKEGGGCG